MLTCLEWFTHIPLHTHIHTLLVVGDANCSSGAMQHFLSKLLTMTLTHACTHTYGKAIESNFWGLVIYPRTQLDAWNQPLPLHYCMSHSVGEAEMQFQDTVWTADMWHTPLWSAKTTGALWRTSCKFLYTPHIVDCVKKQNTPPTVKSGSRWGPGFWCQCL